MAVVHHSRAWRKLRDQVVREDPSCWLRLPGICTGYAQTADHILTVRDHPELAMERANLRGACHPCNRSRNAKTIEQIAGVQNRRRWAV